MSHTHTHTQTHSMEYHHHLHNYADDDDDDEDSSVISMVFDMVELLFCCGGRERRTRPHTNNCESECGAQRCPCYRPGMYVSLCTDDDDDSWWRDDDTDEDDMYLLP